MNNRTREHIVSEHIYHLLSYSDYVLDSRLALFENSLQSSSITKNYNLLKSSHSMSYDQQDWLSIYKRSSAKVSSKYTPYVEQCTHLHALYSTSIYQLFNYSLSKLLKEDTSREKKQTSSLTSPKGLYPTHANLNAYFNRSVYEFDQLLLQYKYCLNHHTIECLGMLIKCDWYTGLEGNVQQWLKSVEDQEALFHGSKHTRKSSMNHQINYSVTIQRLKQEFLAYKTLLQAFTTDGEYREMLKKIRTHLKLQNKVIQFFLQKDTVKCLQHVEFTYKGGCDDQLHYNTLVNTYTKALKDKDVKQNIRKLLRAQKKFVHIDETTNKPKTPFRTHLLHNQPLLSFHKSNTKLYRKMVFMDNLLLKLPSKKKHTSSNTSFGASLIAFIAIQQTQPLYKKLRSFFVHKDSMIVQPYLNIYYQNHPRTQRKRLVVEPMLLQKKDETRRSSNNRVRYSPFKSICLLSDLYWTFLPHLTTTTKPQDTEGVIQQTSVQGIVQHNQVMQNLKQKPTFVLHPTYVAKVYDV